MNFLAHLYLSGNSDDILIGNFIGDAVKGSDYKHYPDEVVKGIKLHRMIDRYTDQHPVVEESKKRLRLNYGKYAGVITDIFYDHFLAKNWDTYSNCPMCAYASRVYRIINENSALLPEKSWLFFNYMLRNDIFTSYARLDGIQHVLTGMSKRARFESGMENATTELKQFYVEFEDDFNLFFPDLIQESQNYMRNL